MKTFTDYLWFTTKKRQEFIRITDEVVRHRQEERRRRRDGAGVGDAHHRGRLRERLGGRADRRLSGWLEKLAPAGLPYKHHQTGEDNADAHLKRTIMGHQVMVPITKGALDLGPWEQIFYAEFDGQRRKRVVVKVMGYWSPRSRDMRESETASIRLDARLLAHRSREISVRDPVSQASDREYPRARSLASAP